MDLIFDPPELGTVLYLPGLPGSGNKIYDRSPYGNNGTITGATWKSLNGIWYLDFDGVQDFLIIGDTSTFKFLHGALDATNFQWSIGWWMTLDTPEPNSLYSMFSNNRGDTAKVGINIYYRGDIGAGNTRRFHLYITTGGGVGTTVVEGYSDDACYPNDSNYHYICITYDQAPATVNARFYVDTVPSGTLNKTANVPSAANANDALYFGILSDGVNFDFFGNAILHRIHNKVLSALEIQNRFNQEKHLFGVW